MRPYFSIYCLSTTVGSNFVLGELISQGRLLGNYIPLKLHRLSVVHKLLRGGGGRLKTPDHRLLRPCYRRQTSLLVSASKRVNFSSPQFKIFKIFIVSNCRYLSKYPPPLTKSTIVILTN